jgi:hypothetical protein
MNGMGQRQKGQEGHSVTRSGVVWRGVGVLLYFIGQSSLPSSSLPPSKHIMVLLVTSDNEQFVVEKDVAERSVLIKNMLEGNSFTLYS